MGLTRAQTSGATGNPSVPKLVSQLSAADFDARFNAGMALVRLGSNAAPAVPAIGRLIETEPQKFHDVMLQVVENCPSAGQSIKPTLQMCLTNPNASLRIGCARTLWLLDKSQADTVRSVAKRSLAETDAGVRIEAASLLWRMDRDANEVVPTLAALLSDPETAYDYRTIKLLGQIGPPAKEAIPALKAWLKTKRMPEAFVSNAAVETLQRIGAEP
jgi:HEAT repeat protein